MPNKYSETIREIYQIFEEHSNAENAVGMENYMKNNFKFLGIKKPLREELSKLWIKKITLTQLDEIPLICKQLWEMYEREYQYVGIELLRKYISFAKVECIKEIEFFICNKSWWDTVDLLATNICAEYFRIYPEKKMEYIDKWNSSDNIWLNRSAILFQLKYKKKTDFELLKAIISTHNTSKEFFIQKAIGWSLREYAKTNREAVIEFIETNPIMPLSKREAIKHLNY
jgi:3-methyladenine DNA glycosylase AlkD